MSIKLTLELILSETNNKNITNLLTLNINGKNINDVSILSKIPTLENVSLVKNNIKDLSVFKNLKNIKNLNLKDNKITELNQIELLKNCKNLESLNLKENPISNEPNYLQKIREILPQLKKLDDIELNQNKNNNKENKKTLKPDNKKINKLNMITNKVIKYKGSKNKNNIKNGSPNHFLGSPMRQNKLKPINNDINNKTNSSGKKEIKEIKEILNNNNVKKVSSIENNNGNSEQKNNNNNNEKSINPPNDEDFFEIMNINDEKKKLENEKENEEKKNPNPKPKKVEILSFSFKKKKTGGTFYFRKKKDTNIEANQTVDNIKIDNQLINTFNDENKTLNYNLSNSRYSRKIIGKFPGAHSLLSQSIRYDDENEDENNNKDSIFAKKNKLASLKNRLFSKLTNQIYNKKINNNVVKENEKEEEIKNEKIIIKSIKLLLSNLGEEELNQINNDVINAISKLDNK